MIQLIEKYKKAIALTFLTIMLTEWMAPLHAYALTSGPSQPEMQGFQPIGNSDMVNLFSGDFSYNIPLMDVGGYPVNISYQSGSGMDDEASWVGYGWSLNVGSLNRNLRGIPDDFNGTDKQQREVNIKDHITYGGRFSMTLDLLGIPKNKVKKKVRKKKLNLSLAANIGVKFDNYRGIGMDISFNNPGLSITEYSAGEHVTIGQDGNNIISTTPDTTTTALDNFIGGGLTLSSQDGATVDLNAKKLFKTYSSEDKRNGISKSIGFSYNSRAGLAGMTLSSSFLGQKKAGKLDEIKGWKTMYTGISSNSFLSFNSDTYSPVIDHSMQNEAYTFSLHLGPEIQVVLPGLGVTGFYSKQKLAERNTSLPAYGIMNSSKGVDISNALMDVQREKDIPYSKEVKYLPIPVPEYDLFSASSQDGGGQYRIYRGGSGVFFEPYIASRSSNFTLGIEAGAGTYFDVGADLYKQNVVTITKKWTERNNFLTKGDFHLPLSSTPLFETAYFKRVGEPVPADKNYLTKIKGTSPVAVSLPSRIDNAVSGAKASDLLRTPGSPNGEAISTLKRDTREVRNTTFSYLNAREAGLGGLEILIKDYYSDSLAISECNNGSLRKEIERISDHRKAHHFSEITITGDDGKRSIYGIPVYNTYQEEVTFSIGENLSARNKGLIKYTSQENSTSNKKGRENYYSKETTPAYATSYLLTGILSPDYTDLTGNGITDDDLGTAVKFNYSKLPFLYKWRTPFARGADTANYNEGFLSDAQDDKANYVYGEKEIWYLNSIESKTMVAWFVTEDRKDALGVLDNRGGVDTNNRLKLLKEIRLYSKSDLYLHGNNPHLTTPIKVVHFEYDYSICQGLPNSLGGVGKLTLKKVYFTFGGNQKGKLSPYEFRYDTTYNAYDHRQYDRWGYFKDAADNPNGLNNSEFPYTLQDTALSNPYVRAWQLNQIILPSGGAITVHYEADDYAYVQDRRASEMCFISGVGTDGENQGLIGADYIYVDLPHPVDNNQELRDRYFDGMTNLYYKTLLDLDGKGHREFVPGYAELDPGEPPVLKSGSNTVAKIKLKKIKGVNPIAKAGWQFIRTNLPKYAYPGSENLESSGSNLRKAIEALVTAFGTIKELVQGFEKRARNKGFSDTLDLSKSWVRLYTPDGKKIGGGSRVRRIDISDDWEAMSETTGAQTSTYSQVYDYTTKDSKGDIISSGVATYEPMVGNDENPFRQPIRYKQNQFLALNNYYYIEEPMGETFFPAPGVGYSKVTVKTVGSGDEETVNRTGTIVNEFYTAKDYPVKIEILGLETRKPSFEKWLKLVSAVSIDVVGLSQGYKIETNDMHGKPKSVHVFNKSGQDISSTEYYYKSENELATSKTLNNSVKVISPDGVVGDGQIGMDVEMYTDMREQTTENLGISVKVSGGSGAILFFPLPFFFPGIGVNIDKRNFRSSSTIKLVNRFAIQYKVVTRENGSSITSENLLWDAETGNVLLTKTQNEFDDPLFSFAYPAHWVYEGMGQAYQNLGTIMSDFSSGTNGTISNAAYNSLLFPGDELIDVFSGSKYWVINSPVADVYAKRLIDNAGEIQTVSAATLKLVRSGRRNMANTGIASIVSLKNPIVGDKLDVSQFTKVLDAKASVFNEEWSAPQYKCLSCPDDYNLSEDGTYCYQSVEATPVDTTHVCEGDQIGPYSACGSMIYTSFNVSGTSYSRYRIDTSNSFWIGNYDDQVTYCPYSPDTVEGIDFRGLPNGKGSKSGDSSSMMNILARTDSVKGPLNRCGAWGCGSARDSINKWYGFSRVINVSSSKIYYIGMAADNQYRFKVDGTVIREQLTNEAENFRIWHIYPVDLKEGQHIIEMEGLNSGSYVSFGAEIYDNTAAEIANAESYDDLNLIFSTKDIVGQQFDIGNYTCPSGYTLYTGTDPYTCRYILPTDYTMNPYKEGVLGNWRPQSSYVYQVSRENFTTDPSKFGSTDIQKSGAYSVFNPFWSYNSSTSVWEKNAAEDSKWIAANDVTFFNAKGVEVENKDALDRYSSALFGYLNSLPVAVASNARYREIGYDGFEDYGFQLPCVGSYLCGTGHFGFQSFLDDSSASISGQYAHSGKYSLALSESITLDKSVFNYTPGPLYTFGSSGEFQIGSLEMRRGFSPIPGKKYVLSFWLKDGMPRTDTTDFEVSVNGVSVYATYNKFPVVEGWKRVEAQFTVPSMATAFFLDLAPGSGTDYIDDIRIFPYDGQMKSFAYDPSSQRLMAELDENNFATFYEYDDEGILIRVKKETERGIMTIKETRSSYRKRPVLNP